MNFLQADCFQKALSTVRSRAGFTLPEALVTLLIVSFMISGIYMTGLASERYWQVNKARTRLQQELRKAEAGMEYALRQAGDVSITDVPADGTAYSTITFKVPTDVVSGTVSWSANTINFALGGTGNTQLIRTEGGNTTVVAQDIQSLSFSRQASAPDILDVALQAQRNTEYGIPVTYQMDFQVQLRN